MSDEGKSLAVFIMVIVTLVIVIVAMALGAATLAKVDDTLDVLRKRGGSTAAQHNKLDKHGCWAAVGEHWCPKEKKCKVGPCEAGPSPPAPVPVKAGGVGLASTAGPMTIAGGLPANAGSDLKTLTVDSAKQFMAGNTPAVIVVYSNGCGHCVKQKETLAKMNSDGALKNKLIGLLDYAVMKTDAALKAALETTGVPALFQVGHGAVKAKHTGYKNEDQIRELLQ